MKANLKSIITLLIVFAVIIVSVSFITSTFKNEEKFEYSDLMVEKLGGYDVRVSLNVKNIGDMDGDEVVQLYIDDVDSTMVTPPCLLKGFERVHIKVGETKRISMNLDFDSFKLMNRAYEWVVEPGRFRILVGASSRDIRLEGEVAI